MPCGNASHVRRTRRGRRSRTRARWARASGAARARGRARRWRPLASRRGAAESSNPPQAGQTISNVGAAPPASAHFHQVARQVIDEAALHHEHVAEHRFEEAAGLLLGAHCTFGHHHVVLLHHAKDRDLRQAGEGVVLDFLVEGFLPDVVIDARHVPHHVLGEAREDHLVVAAAEAFHVAIDRLLVLAHAMLLVAFSRSSGVFTLKDASRPPSIASSSVSSTHSVSMRRAAARIERSPLSHSVASLPATLPPYAAASG